MKYSFLKAITVPLVALMSSNALWGGIVADLVQSSVLHAMLEALQKMKACLSASCVIQDITKSQPVKLNAHCVQVETIARLLELPSPQFVQLVAIVNKEASRLSLVPMGSTAQLGLRHLWRVQREAIVLTLLQ